MSDLAAQRLAAWVGIGREQAADFISDQIAPAIRKQERERYEELLEEVDEFYGEALGLIRDLLKDAVRIYEPGFEDPPHIRAAKNLGDHEETLRLVRAALEDSDA